MAHVGDVAHAREVFLRDRPPNLCHLLRRRYQWMNRYIADGDRVVELGAGAGLADEFIDADNLLLTDVVGHPWVDLVVDALRPPFARKSLDAVICSHMIHHMAKPVVFLRAIRETLKLGGHLLIQDVHTSLLMRLLLRLKSHEGWRYDVDVFSENTVANDPADPWSANNAIPELLFRDAQEFERKVPGFEVVENRLCECFLVPLAGGVVAKSPTVQMPRIILRLVDGLDGVLVRWFPNLFALGRSVALKRTA
jgi:SAM-dependent methyltransferase